MGCGASNSEQNTIKPVEQLPTVSPPPKVVEKESKSPAKKTKNQETSLRTSNINASTNNKMTNSKSTPKVLSSSTKVEEKSPQKNSLRVSNSSLKQSKKDAKTEKKTQIKSARNSTNSLAVLSVSPSKVKVNIDQMPEEEDGNIKDDKEENLKGTKSKKKKVIDPKLQEFMKIYGV